MGALQFRNRDVNQRQAMGTFDWDDLAATGLTLGKHTIHP